MKKISFLQKTTIHFSRGSIILAFATTAPKPCTFVLGKRELLQHQMYLHVTYIYNVVVFVNASCFGPQWSAYLKSPFSISFSSSVSTSCVPALSFQVYQILFSGGEAELALGDQCAGAEIRLPCLCGPRAVRVLPRYVPITFPTCDSATALPLAFGKPHASLRCPNVPWTLQVSLFKR